MSSRPGDSAILNEADRRWALLEAARESLLTAVARSGATRIEYTAGFPELDTFTVWLCVETDAQRDALQPWKNPAFTRVFQVLFDAGFSEDELLGLSTVAESQETVDRDYKGIWLDATG